MSIYFKIFWVSQSYFLQMGKFEAINLMYMPSHVWSHILRIFGSKEDKAWEYNENDHILIINLHKLLAPVNYDDKKQMSSILAHVHLGVIDHVVIHAYLESCTRDRYYGRSMTFYHPINVEWFPELDGLVRNPPPNVLVTIKSHGDVDNNNDWLPLSIWINHRENLCMNDSMCQLPCVIFYIVFNYNEACFI